MLFLDKCVKVALLEEGQTLVTLEDLGITPDDLNTLFEGIYEQARPYIQRYVKKVIQASTSPLYLPDAVSIKRVSYNTFMNSYNRTIPDIPQSNWDFNPHTRMFTTYASMSYIVEYLCYPKCGNLEVVDSVVPTPDEELIIKLPCKISAKTLKLTQKDVTYSFIDEDDDFYNYFSEDNYYVKIKKSSPQELILRLSQPEPVQYVFRTLNYAIEEWDMKAEIFMVWFKAALLSMIGAIKEQAGNIDSGSMPFDVNRDGLLSRARELYARLDELKITKSNWWEW